MGDKRPLYKFLNRTHSTAMNHYFSGAEEEEHVVKNQRLGRTWGLDVPRRNVHKPGDRFLHVHAESRQNRLDPSEQPPAGQQSYSPLLDQERWRAHNTISLLNGSQRA